jgi:nitrogen fixation negative regulator NifL
MKKACFKNRGCLFMVECVVMGKDINNITDSKRSEEAIRESEEKFQLLLNSTGEAIYGIDLNGNCTFCNPACLRLLGYEDESQLFGRHMHDLIHHTRKDGTHYPVEECCIYQAFREGKGTHVDDEVFWRVDGTSFETEYRSFPIIRDGNTVGSVVSFVDATIRKQAEREIIELNESLEERVLERTAEVAKLSHAIEHSSATVVITDTEGNIEYANPRFEQLTGYSIEEAIGKNPGILKSGETPHEVYEELWSTIKLGCEWKGEFCNRKKNGDLYWESASISPVKNAEGVITNFIAVKDDITERKHAEEALIQSENRLSEAQRVGKIGSFTLNVTTGHWSGTDMLYSILGIGKKREYSVEEWVEIIHPDHRDSLATYQESVLDKKIPFDKDYLIIRKSDGETRWVYSRGELQLDDSGNVIGMIGTTQDITEQRKMEETLIQSEKLKSIGTITAGISHEFNNILAIISGKTELLEMIYKDNKELVDELRIIKRAAHDGAAISSNMLKFTKVHQDTKEFISCDIKDLIRDSIAFTKPRWQNEAQSRGIDYKMSTEGVREVLPIMCKPAEIREIFINIINNALDAMPGGGAISFDAWTGDDTIHVSIADTGEGMPEYIVRNIFDPFFSTKGVEGTGLGMSMVYGIVTRHGGEIEVNSEIGKGTMFTLQFPTTNKEKTLIEAPDTEQKTNVKSLRILVVDDEDRIRDILNQFLSMDGHNVKTVDNGADAINMVEGEEFDIVLCDLAMPNVFGYDVVRVINGLKKRPKIGIITGWDKDHASDKDMKIDFYIKKPFTHSELTKHIKEAFVKDSKWPGS